MSVMAELLLSKVLVALFQAVKLLLPETWVNKDGLTWRRVVH